MVQAAFRAYLRRVGRTVSPTPAPQSKAHEHEDGGCAASAAGAAGEGGGVAELDFDEPQDRAVFDFTGSPVKGRGMPAPPATPSPSLTAYASVPRAGPRRMVAKQGSLVSPGKLSGASRAPCARGSGAALTAAGAQGCWRGAR